MVTPAAFSISAETMWSVEPTFAPAMETTRSPFLAASTKSASEFIGESARATTSRSMRASMASGVTFS